MFVEIVVKNIANALELREQAAKSEYSKALPICAGQGHWQIIEELVKAGADLSEVDFEGNTALHVVVSESVNKHQKIDQLLQV